jgi:hypothetical protein
MWKIMEVAIYFATIALCVYHFAYTAPAIAREAQILGTELVAQGISTPDSQDVNKILELGPWGIVFILSVKLVVDYFNKSKEQERCNVKIKESEEHLSALLKELRTQIEKGVEENYDAISEMQQRIEKETSEIRITIGRLDQQIAHVGIKTDEMYNWHNLNDDSGSKVWYVRRQVYSSLDKLVDVQREQSTILQNQQAILDRILKDIEKK